MVDMQILVEKTSSILKDMRDTPANCWTNNNHDQYTEIFYLEKLLLSWLRKSVYVEGVNWSFYERSHPFPRLQLQLWNHPIFCSCNVKELPKICEYQLSKLALVGRWPSGKGLEPRFSDEISFFLSMFS